MDDNKVREITCKDDDRIFKILIMDNIGRGYIADMTISEMSKGSGERFFIEYFKDSKLATTLICLDYIDPECKVKTVEDYDNLMEQISPKAYYEYSTGEIAQA